ncbi:hypothetical protein BZG36_02020 [Bifiguratus adelaidae]|uniref:PPM-type phosphatase domain-containing protein n=1 Tax=Bifiguratus adelaidae TaxID=1938954 RepID=A0A261Y467_9FUNG|nr:hypothetical protein BZG36_02020 [Bifiguratus adelaidae]
MSDSVTSSEPQSMAEQTSEFRVGFTEDRNKRCRRTMEDAHSYVYDFDNIPGQGFFAIFDGHAGKDAADWCGEYFHETFQQCLQQSPSSSVPEVFNTTFLEVDRQLSQRESRHSGCTAVVAFLQKKSSEQDPHANGQDGSPTGGTKRILYTANAGDARAVLCRDGKAVRLSYDHKGSDAQEAKRIIDLGGFVMNNRVNGVLAVTRSLGDSTMKEFVVGNPYTTETELKDSDPFLILACDGLWDVCEDQEAVDLIADIEDPQVASQKLLDHAIANFSTDNLSVMVIKFEHV